MVSEKIRTNFIRQIIEADLNSGKHKKIITRFPPEPNGYLHIGHAKSIVLNFGLAQDFNGTCNLRFDDTNPQKENREFVESIQKDVKWLGYDWGEKLLFASDYFEQLYLFAIELIKKGLAYVCELNPEELRLYRGTLTEPGRASPNRDRSIIENLDLFNRMRAGEFPDGALTLRARIDMNSPNINLRDPVLYRIKHDVIHHQTSNKWCLYPTYDYTHPLSDALECITHSLCTLEFEDHRPFYDWCINNIPVPCRPRQIEFSRLNLEYTILSKRYLTELVHEGLVQGWDDPRMPTLAGLRRRGYTPRAIREFCERIGVTKADNRVELALLENILREDLDLTAPRRMAVFNPLRVILLNYPARHTEWLTAPNHPKDLALGTRQIPFGREIYIDHADFAEHPPKGFKRLTLENEIRLRYAYLIKVEQVIKGLNGEISELHATVDLDTLGRNPVGRKACGVIHWVPVTQGIPAEVRLYDRLFRVPNPGSERDWRVDLNPDSLKILTNCVMEPALQDADLDTRFQFEREGYFILDPETTAQHLIFNRTVSLRDSWKQ